MSTTSSDDDYYSDQNPFLLQQHQRSVNFNDQFDEFEYDDNDDDDDDANAKSRRRRHTSRNGRGYRSPYHGSNVRPDPRAIYLPAFLIMFLGIFVILSMGGKQHGAAPATMGANSSSVDDLDLETATLVPVEGSEMIGNDTIDDNSKSESKSKSKASSPPSNPLPLRTYTLPSPYPFDPFHLSPPPHHYGHPYTPPPFPHSPTPRRGYYTLPSIHNSSIAFVSEGDIYLTSPTSPAVASRLTTTTGNALDPHINPVYPFFICYSATYDGRRDIYLLDLRTTTIPTRLTYLAPSSVYSVVGWTEDGNGIIYTTSSRSMGLPNTRAYVHRLQSSSAEEEDDDIIPLSQTSSGIFHGDCFYFVRFRQSSRTFRYKGGSVESLWAWCRGESSAVALTTDYKGSDTLPRVYGDFLFFISDRNDDGERLATRNLFAMRLPSRKKLYKNKWDREVRRLTSVSCRHDGRQLMEYDIDVVTGDVILRIGADLHILKGEEVDAFLSSSGSRPIDDQLVDISLLSDFHGLRERLIPIDVSSDLTSLDIYTSSGQRPRALATFRGQAYTLGILPEGALPYDGSHPLPPRTWRLGPGVMKGGSVRIQSVAHVTGEMALVLASDFTSPTGELGFFNISLGGESTVSFAGETMIPLNADPLGSVYVETIAVAPNGVRVAWSDTDGRIVVMTIASGDMVLLPTATDDGVSLVGDDETELSFSPEGRWLAVGHAARNQFRVLSLVDLGVDRETVVIGNVTSATPDRFNSQDVVWGQEDGGGKSVLYFLSDRNVVTDVTSPWGTRAPNPHFLKKWSVYALPLESAAVYKGGGAAELYPEEDEEEEEEEGEEEGLMGGFNLSDIISMVTASLAGDNITNITTSGNTTTKDALTTPSSPLNDINISFTPHFPHTAYRLSHIPQDTYYSLLSQTTDHTGLILIHRSSSSTSSTLTPQHHPLTPTSDEADEISIPDLISITINTARTHLSFITERDFILTVPNSQSGLASLLSSAPSFQKNRVDTHHLALSVYPPLEYEQMYLDAWRMLRDYFYDKDLHNVDWMTVLERYRPLVGRCAKREELDDVLGQMASELSALHVFVYGGEYDSPMEGKDEMIYQFGNLGAELRRSVKWNGYEVVDVWEGDADFDVVESSVVYSPLGEGVLRLSGQKGLERGDVIYRVNGEGVMEVPDLNVLLRGMAGRSVRLEVMRWGSSVEGRRLRESVRGLEKGNHDDDDEDDDDDYNGDKEINDKDRENMKEIDTDDSKEDEDSSKKSDNSNQDDDDDDDHNQEASDNNKVTKKVDNKEEDDDDDDNDDHNQDASDDEKAAELKDEEDDDDNQITSTTTPTTITTALLPQPLITVPLTPTQASNLLYTTWETRTATQAQNLAKSFTIGYIHLRSMSGPDDMDAFARSFYPHIDKEALILDLRNNHGGNIDSWIITIFQKKAWQYWQSRGHDVTNGGLGWDEQFAFRGHVVVLINEHTSSDGEGLAQGMKTLGLAKLVGMRTWGGGIWLSSDNRLVDGGIATAPEMGTYNAEFGWGLGIEQMGVEPDVVVDCDPRESFDGRDDQLEMAVEVLRDWLEKEPLGVLERRGGYPDMSLKKEVEGCAAK